MQLHAKYVIGKSANMYIQYIIFKFDFRLREINFDLRLHTI